MPIAIAAKIAALLDGLTVEQLNELPPVERRRFVDLCRHWAAVAEPDRKVEAPEGGVLEASTAGADSFDKALSQPVECRQEEPWRPNAMERERGVLSLEAMGLCKNTRTADSPFAPLAPHCADCGMWPTLDPVLKICGRTGAKRLAAYDRCRGPVARAT